MYYDDLGFYETENVDKWVPKKELTFSDGTYLRFSEIPILTYLHEQRTESFS